jgi:predicted type IV restriction endonuclease
MDFVDEVRSLAAKTSGILEHIRTEAAVRTALVEPFIKALGYDTSDPAEVVPEFGANIKVQGVRQDEHVDYAIAKDGKPIIFIEVKPHDQDPQKGYKQLYDYFARFPEARIAIATNGLIYRFYADLEKSHIMDSTPFLELNMLNFQESLAEELKKLTKSAFDIDGMVTSANELKFVGGILNILMQQVNTTDEEFAAYFFRQLCPDKNFRGGIRQDFATFTQKALKQFVREQIKSLLDASAVGNAAVASTGAVVPVLATVDSENVSNEPDSTKQRIVTTEEEMEGFYIVKSILREIIDPSRVSHRDTVSYFGILLDDNKNKPICRLYFNNPQNKKLELLSYSADGRKEEKVSINDLNEIYQYASRLKAAVSYHEKK